jgi:carbamate kinase
VYREYGTERAAPIRRMSVAEAESLVKNGQCGAGSMRPKVEAAVAFARTGGRAIIAELSQGIAAIRGETGTTIVTED